MGYPGEQSSEEIQQEISREFCMRSFCHEVNTCIYVIVSVVLEEGGKNGSDGLWGRKWKGGGW